MCYTSQLSGDLSGMKVGILTEGFEECEPEVEKLVRQAAGKLAQKGAKVEEISIPMHSDSMLGCCVSVDV